MALFSEFGREDTKIILFACVITMLSISNENIQSDMLNLPAKIFTNWTAESMMAQSTNGVQPAELTAVWGFIVAVLSIGGITGAAISMPLASYLGRKPILFYLANIATLFGCALGSWGWYITNVELLITSRYIQGVAIGLALVSLPIYLTECCGKRLRGLLGAIHGPFGCIASGIAFLISMKTIAGNRTYLVYLICLPVPFAILQIILGFISPESPKYIYAKTRDIDKVNCEMRHFYENPDEIIDLSDFNQCDDQKQDSFGELLKDCYQNKGIRRGLMLSYAIGLTRNFSGQAMEENFSGPILSGMGLSDYDISLVLVCIPFAGACVACIGVAIVHSVGRRKGFLSAIVCHIVLWVSFVILQYCPTNAAIQWSSAMLFFINTVIVYQLGCGIIPYFMASELVVTSKRHIAAMFSLFGLFTSGLVVNFLYPPLNFAIGPSAIIVLQVIPLILCFIYLYRNLPETKGKTIAEVVDELEQ